MHRPGVRNRDFASGSGLSLFTRKTCTLSSSDPLYRSTSIPCAVRVLASRVPVPVHIPCICLCLFNLCLAAVLAFVSYCWVHDLRPSPTEEIWSRSPILWMLPTASTGSRVRITASSRQRSKVYDIYQVTDYRVQTMPLSYCALLNVKRGLRLGTYSSLPVHGIVEMTVVTVAGITPKRPSNVMVSCQVQT
jgi:hypothetical protein